MARYSRRHRKNFMCRVLPDRTSWPDLPHIPRFIEALTPMPGVYAPVAAAEEKPNAQRHTLSSTEYAQRHQPYRPRMFPISCHHQAIN